MPLISLSNPRNKASIIVALLLLELVLILWFRETLPVSEGTKRRASVLRPRSSHDWLNVQEDLDYRQQQQPLQYDHQNDRVGSESYDSSVGLQKTKYRHQHMEKDTITTINLRARRKHEPKEENKAPHHHHHHQSHRHHRQQNPIIQILSAMRKKYSVVNGFSVKKTEPATLAPRATSKSSSSGGDKNSSRSNSSSGNNPNINNDNYDSSSNEQDKKKSIPVETNPTKKQKGQQQQRHRNIAREKNERGGFKSTEERKLAQLIPVLDEDGIIIEDHFISPRDTDGDGIPDSYVLLRPAPSSEYMADIGLFDDDIAPPIPAVPSLATITAPAATTTTTGTNSEASIMGTISVAEANSLASATAFVPL